MRFEIVVPDNTGHDIEAKLLALTQRLSDMPELVREIALGNDEAITLTQKQLADVRESQNQFNAGQGKSLEQLRNSLDSHQNEWLAANQH